MTARDITGVGLIGGGRWASTIASVLPGVLKDTAVHVVSESNPEAWTHLTSRPGWTTHRSISELLKRPEISHVIIARRAADHAETTLTALEHGASVLVEKPFAVTAHDARRVVAAADDMPCHTGLVFAHAENQVRFREAVGAAGRVTGIKVRFGDPQDEMRWSRTKRYDTALNVVQDVLPHAWSLAHPFVTEAMQLESVTAKSGGARIDLVLRAGRVPILVSLSRTAPVRQRVLRIETSAGAAELDFAAEPGTAKVSAAEIDVATNYSSPLAAELSAFLTGRMPKLTNVRSAIESIELAEQALERIRPAQAEAIRLALAPGADATERIDGAYAVLEIMAGGVGGDGRSSGIDEIARWLGGPVREMRPGLIALKASSRYDSLDTSYSYEPDWNA